MKKKTTGKKTGKPVKTAKKTAKKPVRKKAATKVRKKAAKPSSKKLPKKNLNYFRDKLLLLRVSITENMNHFQKTALYHSQKDSSGDLSGYGIHQADSATDAFDIDFSLGLATSSQEILHEIDEALERIDNGTYGFSELSGKFIGKKRLNAVPHARFTKDEQEVFERKKRAGF
ncbi:MAG: hypothetical protein P9M00_08865 [Candidatus Tritonobacter lacicola]|nr:hypothetical protein [Candidatus Tritonobacter lacicola]